MPRVFRETVAEKSADVLRERILTGDLEPGDALTEEAVAEDLGVSRATVRQALNTLRIEGILTRHPTTRVLQITRLHDDDVRDIYRARRFLELGGVDAAQRAGPEAIQRLVDAVDELKKAADDDDVLATVEADYHCHAEIVAFLGSTRLSAAHAQLMAQLRLAITKVSISQDDADDDYAAHRTFLDLLLAGDFGGARRNLATRLDNAERDVLGEAAPD